MSGATAGNSGERGSPPIRPAPGSSGDTIADECPWCRTADPTAVEHCLNCGRPVRPPDPPAAVPPTAPVAVAPVATRAAPAWPPPPRPATPPVDPVVVALRSQRRALGQRARADVLGPRPQLVVLALVAMSIAAIAAVAILLSSRDSGGDAVRDTALPPITAAPSAGSAVPPADSVAQLPPPPTSIVDTATPLAPTPVTVAPPLATTPATSVSPPPTPATAASTTVAAPPD